MKHTCGGCDATWTGTNMAHCGAVDCHRTFSSVALFDAHRAGELCRDPAEMVIEGGVHAGEKRMRLNDHNVWVGNQPRPQFWETQEVA